MGIKISMQEKTQFFDEAWRKAGLLRHDNSFETLMREFELRPGMKLVIFDFQPQENTVMRFEIEASPLDFGFCLSGNIRSTFTRSQGRKEVFISKPGESYVSFLPNSLGTIEYLAGQSILTVGIFVDLPIFDTLIEGHFDEIPADFRRITDGSSKDNYVRTGFMTAAMQMAVHQLLNCPYRGALKQMYIESKVMELITHRLAQFEENRCEKTAQLYPDDIERLHEARDILIRSMENAPTLLGLSRQVGLSDTKLKRGFRQVFGTTVFGCLRAYRMERGRQLLAEGKMNVTEVSYEVGYSERANFTRAFTKQFGVSPLFYLREARKGISSTN
jgi:AraC-like DNA-binding protein